MTDEGIRKKAALILARRERTGQHTRDVTLMRGMANLLTNCKDKRVDLLQSPSKVHITTDDLITLMYGWRKLRERLHKEEHQ